MRRFRGIWPREDQGVLQGGASGRSDAPEWSAPGRAGPH
ncbi:Hypothetical protein CAP_1880 [Chondromyces apiculatus DSM 436]|uniref:Uncharacterized protein n=1 Tax=Chondromyces apiculatus DSM 436 TaxID=1192034 RepID=A0A017TC08_9BACT|nr:Hypothetical protein CAP_1880 [Chondromyces apiculatus DSM 436]